MYHYNLAASDIEVIYNGVDTNVFTPENRLRYRNNTRAKYTIAPDDVLLLFVGSGFKRKGLKHAIAALSLVVNTHKKMKLLIVGNGNIRKYQKLLEKKGISDRVIFAGVCSHIQEIYAAGDIFILPSEYDPFPTVCLEAMASGLPVVVSKTSGVSEIITHGKDGFVVNHPIADEEIADYITVLLEKEKRERMGFAARQKSEMYSFEVNIQKTLNIYHEVLDTQNKNEY